MLCLQCVYSSKLLIDALTEMNEFLAYQQSTQDKEELERITVEFEDTLKFYQSDTVDGHLLEMVQALFAGDFNTTAEMFETIPVGEDSNLESFRYFTHFLGEIIEGIPEVYDTPNISLEDLAFNSKKDKDLKTFKKLDYLSLMTFWMSNTPRTNKHISPPDLTEALKALESTYLTYLTTLTPNSPPSSLNFSTQTPPSCTESLHKYLNLAKTCRDYFYTTSPNAVHHFTNIGAFSAQTVSLTAEKMFKNSEKLVDTFRILELEDYDLDMVGFTMTKDFNNSAEIFKKFQEEKSKRLTARRQRDFNGTETVTEQDINIAASVDLGDQENQKISYYKQMAKHSKHSEYHIILGNLYLLGDIAKGIKPNRELSILYFEEAAKRGSNVAHYNLGLLLQPEQPWRAFSHFKACADDNFTTCDLALGTMYYQPERFGFEKNVTLAIEHLEKAQEGEFYEASSILAHIYLKEPGFIDKEKAYKSLDHALNDNWNMNAKLMMAAYYYENSFKEFSLEKCDKVNELLRKLITLNEGERWSNLAFQVYYSSDFAKKYPTDQKILWKEENALLLFSYASLLGHQGSSYIAAKIWENSELSFKCKFGNRMICASYFYLRFYYSYPDHSLMAVKAADLLMKLDEFSHLEGDKEATSQMVHLSEKMAFKIYEVLSDKQPKAKFSLAYCYYTGKGIEMNQTKANDLWNSLASEAWNSKIDITNIFPALFARYYFDLKEWLFS
ncbi:unnamed protein product [Moneuplotes crassus]|uniref:Uncharacterized protein n=1 Tax=Euplotes crassus TaxID=5936 RepID=A0AAD1Y5A0_EUPCR|nr:unnamed protein product [Moneuplotes crassus]